MSGKPEQFRFMSWRNIMTPTKKWTVLVWIAGDNNLEDFGADDIREMKECHEAWLPDIAPFVGFLKKCMCPDGIFPAPSRESCLGM
jgi:hypothetical protein